MCLVAPATAPDALIWPAHHTGAKGAPDSVLEFRRVDDSRCGCFVTSAPAESEWATSARLLERADLRGSRGTSLGKAVAVRARWPLPVLALRVHRRAPAWTPFVDDAQAGETDQADEAEGGEADGGDTSFLPHHARRARESAALPERALPPHPASNLRPATGGHPDFGARVAVTVKESA